MQTAVTGWVVRDIGMQKSKCFKILYVYFLYPCFSGKKVKCRVERTTNMHDSTCYSSNGLTFTMYKANGNKAGKGI